MGTKNKPGAFDCYAAARPDEPMFILLERDPLAPGLVELWADQREQGRGPSAKADEARACAKTMRDWQAAMAPAPSPVDPLHEIRMRHSDAVDAWQKAGELGGSSACPRLIDFTTCAQCGTNNTKELTFDVAHGDYRCEAYRGCIERRGFGCRVDMNTGATCMYGTFRCVSTHVVETSITTEKIGEYQVEIRHRGGQHRRDRVEDGVPAQASKQASVDRSQGSSHRQHGDGDGRRVEGADSTQQAAGGSTSATGDHDRWRDVGVTRLVVDPLVVLSMGRRKRLKRFVQDHAPGGCKLFSKGNECDCLLCIVDDAFSMVQAADDERVVILEHMKAHRAWVLERGRLAVEEAALVEQTLNAMIQFCEARQHSAMTHKREVTFTEAWIATGRQYGADALENVQFGWELHETHGATPFDDAWKMTLCAYGTQELAQVKLGWDLRESIITVSQASPPNRFELAALHRDAVTARALHLAEQKRRLEPQQGSSDMPMAWIDMVNALSTLDMVRGGNMCKAEETTP